MRLNGVHAPVGTLLGGATKYSKIQVLVTVVENDERGVVVRRATDEELRPEAFQHAPNSLSEHHAIPLRQSPYGLIRQFGPREKTPVKIVFDGVFDDPAMPPRHVRRHRRG